MKNLSLLFHIQPFTGHQSTRQTLLMNLRNCSLPYGLSLTVSALLVVVIFILITPLTAVPNNWFIMDDLGLAEHVTGPVRLQGAHTGFNCA